MARILIIDDDLAMDVLTDGLRYRGHDVARIPSAEQALSRIDEISNAELVVLDIIMPWPDGRPAGGLSSASTAGMEIVIL
jgi:CheY-like chemotaxis protein